jgi:hypothetical protein
MDEYRLSLLWTFAGVVRLREPLAGVAAEHAIGPTESSEAVHRLLLPEVRAIYELQVREYVVQTPQRGGDLRGDSS